MDKNSVVAAQQAVGIGGRIFLSLWCLIWSAFTLGFDGFIVYGLWKQCVALSYPTTPGEITHSAAVHVGSKNSERFEVKYKYALDGGDFLGTQYRYSAMSSNDGAARRLVERYPVGKQVAVHYRPTKPADAVLVVGPQGSDLFMAMFLMPFNMIMIGSWAMCLWGLRRSKADEPAAGLPITERGNEVTVRLPGSSPLLTAAVVVGGLSFAMVFVIGFSAGFDPALSTMLTVWTVILGLAAVAYIKVARPRWNGANDLAINPLLGTVMLPEVVQAATNPIHIADVTGVTVSSGPRKKGGLTITGGHAVQIYWRNDQGSTDSASLTVFNDPGQAEVFAEWLRQTMKYSTGSGTPQSL